VACGKGAAQQLCERWKQHSIPHTCYSEQVTGRQVAVWVGGQATGGRQHTAGSTLYLVDRHKGCECRWAHCHIVDHAEPVGQVAAGAGHVADAGAQNKDGAPVLNRILVGVPAHMEAGQGAGRLWRIGWRQGQEQGRGRGPQ